MPTGYTCDIEKGISFKDFAINCARAFGALVHMRDEPTAPIPDEIKPDNYHSNELKKHQDELEVLKKMTLKEAKVLAENAYEKSIRENNEVIKKKKALKEKYDAMLEKVENWQPPTQDHLNFKKFMVDQITDSIKFDCDLSYYENKTNKVALMKPAEYRKFLIEICEDDIKYHSKHYQEEIKSCASRTKWIQDLKKSLNQV